MQQEGFWAEEFVQPMRVFRDAGVVGTLATPRGVAPRWTKPVSLRTDPADRLVCLGLRVRTEGLPLTEP
jgi:putative intracellular protease/amidase